MSDETPRYTAQQMREAADCLSRPNEPIRHDELAQAIAMLRQAAETEEAQDTYWLKYINKAVRLCSLCGNSGRIDTTATAISAAGVNAGMVNYCICPNGQAMRKAALRGPEGAGR